MSQTLDVNVLVYASTTRDPRHEAARSLLEQLTTGPRLVTLFWPVLVGYLRIATNPRLLPQALSYQAAMENVEALVRAPTVRTAGEADGFWATFQATSDPLRPTASLVPDAHLVALMHQHGVREIWTHDRDFRKFEGIVVRDPFT